MNRFLLWLAPSSWRDRFGRDVLEMMDASPHQSRDRFDLLRTAVELRIREGKENMWVSRKVMAAVGLVLAVTGLGAMWSAVKQLSNGWAELPMHWWSAPTILPVVLGLVMLFAAILHRPKILEKTS